jgi:protein gp37
MGDRTKIQWADASWNPIRGCSRVSEGCRNCYAAAMAARFASKGMPYDGLAFRSVHGPEWTGVVRLIEEKLDQPLRWKRPRRIFVNSTSDLFHPSVKPEWIDRIVEVMAACPQHTFLVLTKRPENIDTLLYGVTSEHPLRELGGGDYLPNLWLGVSVEDRASLSRIDRLRQQVAALRFVSFEPLLEDLGEVNLAGIGWAIIGGEGFGARPCHIQWIRSLVRQCRAAGTWVFVKQMGATPVIPAVDAAFTGPAVAVEQHRIDAEWPQATHFGNPTKDPALNGRVVLLRGGNGADMQDWPDDLRIRENPMPGGHQAVPDSTQET